MGLPEGLIQQSEPTRYPGNNGISGPAHTVNCAMLGDRYSSSVFGPASQQVKCKVESFTDTPSVEKHAKTRKMRKKIKKKKVKSAEKFSEKSFSENRTCSTDLDTSKQEIEGGSTDSFTKKFQKGAPTGHSSDCKSCKTTNIKACLKDCSHESHEFGSWCSNVCKINVTGKSDATNCSYHHQIWRGKENRPFIWQKSLGNFRKGQGHVSNKSDFTNVEKDVSVQERSFYTQDNSFTGKELHPTPMVSTSGHSDAAYKIKRMVNEERRMHRGFHSKMFPKQRLNGYHSQCFSTSNQVGAQKTVPEKSRLQSHYSFGCKNNASTGIQQQGYGQNFPRLHKSNLSQSMSLSTRYQLHRRNNVTCGSYRVDLFSAASPYVQKRDTITGQGGFQQHNGMKISRCFHTSVDSTQHPRLKVYDKYRKRHDITYGTKAIWVPVCTKDSGTLEKAYSASICDSHDISQCTCNESINSHSKGNLVPLHVATTFDYKSSSYLSSHRITSDEIEASKSRGFYDGEKDSSNTDMACSVKLRDASQFLESQATIEAANVSHELKPKSQRAQTMDHLLAEFERFVHYAAPVITSSCVCENMLSNNFLCKHQVPNISLQAVWKWYERASNYGLEVKASDSQNLKDLCAESVSFSAYFVPLLSAVQLFGYTHQSDSCEKDQLCTSSKMNNKRDAKSNSSPRKRFPYKVFHCCGGDSLSFIPSCSNDPELVFEFFESEKPQQRKPLHMKLEMYCAKMHANQNEWILLLMHHKDKKEDQKNVNGLIDIKRSDSGLPLPLETFLHQSLHNYRIAELINTGTSNLQVFGESSKLDSFNLHELHPASWFSVAWYPIYQIPEGNFRASFLTYHSLGQFIGKCIPIGSLNKKLFYSVFPVIGLQSYNTQGECWFDLRVPVEFSSRESMSRRTDLLKERIRTLEENASLLSRGTVTKDKVKVVNQHPDYEFFISRKP